jgi:hypothetical protein
MKKALISPTEQVQDYFGNSGCRVAQIEELTFEVAPPLYWLECPDDCVANEWYWIENQLRPLPQPPVETVEE